MSLGVKRSMASVARTWRKARSTRGWRLYTASAMIAIVAVFGTTVTANALTGKTALSQSHHGPAFASPTLAGFRQGMVPVDGGSIHYVIGGSGPGLLLIHGWPETWWEWHKVMPTLAQDHTVIALDLPGLGNSTVPASGFDAVDTAQRLHQAVGELGFSQVGILAHDLGVLVGYAYARDYPGAVTRLAVLESPLNGFGLESAYSLSFHFLFNQAASPTPENMVNNQLAEQTYLNYMFTFAHNQAAIDRQVYYRAYANPANREAGYDYYRAFPQNEANNLANVSDQLTMPVLAMGGQFSFGAGVAASFDQVAKDVHEVVAPDAGHFIPEEVPGFLGACAELFFSSHPDPNPPPSIAACAP
jgi:pimeloyl-ACP methyl ester carboxylesterase